MSMCLYVTRGPHAELTRRAREPGGLASLTTASLMGRLDELGGGAREEVLAAMGDGPLSDAAFEEGFKEMSRQAWKQGIFAGLYMQLAKGAMRQELRQAQETMRRVQARMRAGEEAEEVDLLDLHKSWHVLHFLFTGSAWEGAAPAAMLLKGGREVGEDLGYGPARVVDADAVKAFAAFLAQVSIEGLAGRLDIPAMAAQGIYCADDEEDDDELVEAELLDMVEHYLPLLKDYVADAAARDHALAIWMS